ncbi:MAG: TIGR00282 family metallophosphoesterase [Candidatus Aureabacteria bacterium]|nr:TIGR00282 family metallophosphoesterase [Candidatus Auribacterota bacterium]
MFQYPESLKVFAAGDVVGKPGRRVLSQIVPELKKKGFDLIIANSENAAGGSGVTPQIADKLLTYGVDVITTGDHFFKNQKIFEDLDRFESLLRPLNFPEGVPGKGCCLYQMKNGEKAAVINLLGRTFINIGNCPFEAVNRALDSIPDEVKYIIVDFHAEATSEKLAMGWFLDGRVSLVYGTHTHVPTADEKILPQGTGYITDIGMTGPQRSILGRDIEPVIKRFTLQIPFRFSIAEEDLALDGLIVELDRITGKTISLSRVRFPYRENAGEREDEEP